MKPTKKSFPLYERPRLRFATFAELTDLDSVREHQSYAVDAIERFANNLHLIDTEITGRKNKRAAFDLIRPSRPYCFDRRDEGWILADRGYESMVPGMVFDEQDINELMLPQWYRSDASWIGWGEGDYPVIDDGFNLNWIPQAAGLVQRIANRLWEKLDREVNANA